ncbi:MAG: hypothetical protein QXG97_06735 [Nitrososphaerota archaeon]
MRVPPSIVLFFLAPAIAELLSGSSPPSEFFNPFGLLLLSSLYGSGALIMRELKVRWNKSYVSLFILGAAYGIIEEGLMVKSFFDPAWMDLGILGVYGRWLDVNWVWAEWLTVYHAVFSVAIPITLVEVAYVGERNKRWIGNRTFAALAVLLAAVTALGYFALTPYRPPSTHYLLATVVVATLIFAAWKVPARTGKRGVLQPLKPSRLALAGFLSAAGLFMLFMGGPYFVPEPPALMLMGLGVIVAIGNFLKRYTWNEKTLYHKFSLAVGAVAFLIALTPIQEFDPKRIDNPRGMLIVGVATFILLFLLKRKLKASLQEIAAAS